MQVKHKAGAASSQSANSYQWFAKSLAEVEETPPSKTALQLRAIGKRAHKEGGREKMLDVFWRLQRRGINVGYAWDGIGGWYK